MRSNKSSFLWLVLLGACSSRQNLVVRSTPAEADVCIKGRNGSEVFSKEKSCIGKTPLELDRVEVVGPDGKKRMVNFSDLNSEENFYLVVSRKGFASEAVIVPSWEHFINLRPEGNVEENFDNNAKLRIYSQPAGALVYVNDVLKGNTPYTVEGQDKSLRLRLEHPGFESFDRVLKVSPGETQEVMLTLTRQPASNKALSSVPAAALEQ